MIPELRAWTEWMAQGGARVTVIDSAGRVLADSAQDPETMENHSNRPEIQQAFATGEGQSVRHSATLGPLISSIAPCDYSPERPACRDPHGAAARGRWILARELRRRLLVASLVILLLGGVASLFVFSGSFAARVERLKDFRCAWPRAISVPAVSKLARRARGSPIPESKQRVRMDRTIHSLSGERNRSSAILRSMVEGVAVIDAQERLVFCNRAFSEILNLDSPAARGARDRGGP